MLDISGKNQSPRSGHIGLPSRKAIGSPPAKLVNRKTDFLGLSLPSIFMHGYIHGFYGHPYMTMDNPWASLDCQWLSMDIHGSLWTIHKYPWIFHGQP